MQSNQEVLRSPCVGPTLNNPLTGVAKEEVEEEDEEGLTPAKGAIRKKSPPRQTH